MNTMLIPENLQKNIPYDNRLLPYSITRTFVANGQPDILFHWHTDMEVIYVHEGSARVHIDEDYFDSQAGDLILIRPNALHSIHPIRNQKHHMTALNFHLDLLGYSTLDEASLTYLQPLYNGQLDLIHVIKPQDTGYETIKQCFMTTLHIGSMQETFFELQLKSQLLQLLYWIFKYHYTYPKSQNSDSYRKEEKIRTVIDYMTAHYAEPITIQDLAELCSYSPTYFMSFFKKQFGQSCMDYLIHYRLKQAQDLLLNSNQQILDIAQQTGFTNLSNFNRQFKKMYQMPPSRYRKIMNLKK